MICTVMVGACPAPLAAIPSRPSDPRVSGTIASGPASPARPNPAGVGKYDGAPMTPPAANGITEPGRPVPGESASPKTLPRSPASSLASGLKACVTAMPDSRSATCLSTSSNCLPPAVASAKALLMALAKAVVLTPSVRVLSRSLSTVSGKNPGRALSTVSKSSVIWISPHQACQHAAVERRDAPGRRFDGAGQLARCHAPELFWRQPQHAKAETHRLFP